MSLVNLAPVDLVIKLALWSAYIANEDQPISLLLCADAEAAKTRAVSQAITLPGIIYPTDCTAFGILTEYGEEIRKRKVRHIIVPDLISPFSKRWETSASFVAFLNNLIEEGILEVRTKALSKKYASEVKCGLIGCITPKELQDSRHRWVGMGFMSRMLPVSWTYKTTTKTAIFDQIIQGIDGKERWADKFPSTDIPVHMPIDFGQALLPYTMTFANAHSTYGFRYQRHLQRLLKASALERGDEVVRGIDLDRLLSCVDILNLKRTAL